MSLAVEMLLVSFMSFLVLATFCWMVDAIRRSKE